MPGEPIIRIRKLRPGTDEDIPLPQYMTARAAGMDIFAAVNGSRTIPPGRVALIPTGFAMALPDGFEAQIRPRSGLAVKHAIGIINSPGTIDADYRGEVMVPLINFGSQNYHIQRGDRIAQMIISKIYRVPVALVNELETTDRDKGGFGHTGR